MQTITRAKMSDWVSEQIKQYIIERKLMPGDRHWKSRSGISRAKMSNRRQ